MIKFLNQYKNNLKHLIDALDNDTLVRIQTAFEQTVTDQSRIYVIGNGGSAATASHIANDFGIGLKRRGIMSLDIISLADNSAVCTAIANDVGYENIFYMQLKDVVRPKDVILAISCSGDSPNVVKAVQYAKENGALIIGLTGFGGGVLRGLSDLNIHINVPKGEYGLVEDMHMIFDHILYSYNCAKIKQE